MNSITVDTNLQRSFSEAAGLTAIHDTAGNLLGYYAPATNPDAAAIATVAARIDRAELQRRKEWTGKWYTTTEVLEHLKSLEQ